MMFLGIHVGLKRRCNSFETLVDLAYVEVIPWGWKPIILEQSIHLCTIVHLSFQAWSKEDAAMKTFVGYTLEVENDNCGEVVVPTFTYISQLRQLACPCSLQVHSTCLPPCPTLAFALLLNVQLEHRGGNVKQVQVGLECVVAM